MALFQKQLGQVSTRKV